MAKIDSSVLRAHNMLLENASPESISNETVQEPIIQDPQRAGRDYRRFLENGARVEIVVPDHHIIDCRFPSWPKQKGWNQDGPWSVSQHRNMGFQVFDSESIKLFHWDRQEVGPVKGTDLQRVLQKEAILPDALLDFYRSHEHLVPRGWKYDDPDHGFRIYFWGTTYHQQLSHGRGGVQLYVRYIECGPGFRLRHGYSRVHDKDWDRKRTAAVLGS